MSKKVFYLAHPVTGDPLGNCIKAEAWIRWLTLNVPEHIFTAPWVAEVRAFADENALPEFYDRVLADDQEVVRHCDGILLVGGKVSKGMQLELDAAMECPERTIIDWHYMMTPADVGLLGVEALRRGD